MRWTGVLLTATLTIALAACAGEETGAMDAETVESLFQSSEEEPAFPACDDVWILGTTLPEGYRGCIDRDGYDVPSRVMHCDPSPGSDEYLYWYEDGPASYYAWMDAKRDYPVELEIEDGNQIPQGGGARILNFAKRICAEG